VLFDLNNMNVVAFYVAPSGVLVFCCKANCNTETCLCKPNLLVFMVLFINGVHPVCILSSCVWSVVSEQDRFLRTVYCGGKARLRLINVSWVVKYLFHLVR
jgi:hypothetical protein